MFTVFWIVVAVVLTLDFIGAIVLCVLENKMKKVHPDNEGELAIESATSRISGKDIYLHVTDGVVTIIDELPTVEVEVAGAPVAVAAPATAPAEAEADEAVTVQAAEQVPAQADDIPAEAEVDEEGRVVIIAASDNKQTYLERLAALDHQIYALYEQLVNYLLSKESVKQITTNNKAIFKYKTDRLMISSVRRGVIVLQFMLANPDLNRYMRAEGGKQIKVTPVTIRLTDETSLEEAKSAADLTLQYLSNEREYNAEKKKEARREARRAKAEAEARARAAADNADGSAE